jgi:rhodanese-related sulfurtransferase
MTDTPAQNALSVQGLAAWRAAGTPHHLLDVREPYECGIAAIGGAQHIPMGQIPARLGEIPAGVALVVMCHHGARSQSVVNFLRQAGRDQVLNLQGGIDAWSQHIDPAVARY